MDRVRKCPVSPFPHENEIADAGREMENEKGERIRTGDPGSPQPLAGLECRVSDAGRALMKTAEADSAPCARSLCFAAAHAEPRSPSNARARSPLRSQPCGGWCGRCSPPPRSLCALGSCCQGQRSPELLLRRSQVASRPSEASVCLSLFI